MGLKKYLKRGAKFIATGRVQPIIKAEISTSSPDSLFKEKIYVVTGGGGGLGLAIAKSIIAHGGQVIITGRNKDKLESAKKTLGSKRCSAYVCDLQKVDECIKLIDFAFDEYGHIDGLINNAGISLHEWDFLKVDEEKFDSQFLTNLRGSYFITQEYVKNLLQKKLHGNIIFISSERGTMCDDLPYGLTKAAIDSLTKALSLKYYKMGIRVNSVAPGVTATALTGINKDSDLFNESNSGRFFVPEEVAETVTFLLSDTSKCISGEVIHTNGGNHLKRGY